MVEPIEVPSSDGRRSVWKFGQAVLDESVGRLSAGDLTTMLDHSTHGILLCLLRNSTQVVLKDALFEAGWPGRVTSDSSLTKAIHRLRLALGDPEGELIRTVHGYGYQLAVSAVRESEPNGEPGNGNPVAPAKTAPRRTAMYVVAAVALILVAGAASWDRIRNAFAPSAAAVPETPTAATAAYTPPAAAAITLAVLPFEDKSDAKDQEFLSDGLSEELIHMLSKVSGMQVAKRSKSFELRNSKLSVPDRAKKLGVEMLLQGSLRRDGDQLHVAVQLVRADGSQLWAETYERRMDDILEVEREIATTVADRLRLKLFGLIPAPRIMSPQAYPLILEADVYANENTAVGNARAVSLYEKALEVAPREPWAWSGLGRVYANQAYFGQAPRAEASRKAKTALHRSLALDPHDAIAIAQLAWVYSNLDNDPRAAAEYYQMALAKAPGEQAVVGNVAIFLQTLGRMDEAIELARFYVRRVPNSATAHGELGVDYYFVGRWEEAIASSRTALKLSPGYTGAHAIIGTSLLLGGGDKSVALEEIRAESDEIYRMSSLPLAYHALGRRTEADAALAQFTKDHASDSPMLVAAIHAYRDEPDQAFAWLDKAIATSDPYVQYALVEPLYRSLHEDPRWNTFLRKAGKAPEQLAAIRFKVILPG